MKKQASTVSSPASPVLGSLLQASLLQASLLQASLLLASLLSLAACAPTGSLAILDEYFVALAPSAAAAFTAHTASQLVLKGSELSSELYQRLQTNPPQQLFLSPVFLSEIPTILSEFPEIDLAYIGGPPTVTDDRLHVISFEVERAALQAGRLARRHLEATPASQRGGRVALVMPDGTAPAVGQAFSGQIADLLPADQPLIEVFVGAAYSAEAVAAYREMDIAIAFLAVPSGQVNQYIEIMFDPSCFIIATLPFGYRLFSAADLVLSWDFSGALDQLSRQIGQQPGSINSLEWKEQDIDHK